MRKTVVASFIGRHHEFQLAEAVEAERAAAQAGLGIEILFAEENAIVQIHQLFQKINLPEAERAAAFVVEPVKDEGMERLARNAVAAGIGWLPLNHSAPYVRKLREDYPSLPICNVVTDQVEAGRTQGRQIRALLPNGGHVLYLHGPAMRLVEERRRGTEEAIAGAGVALRRVSGIWTEASGERAVAGWLRLRHGSSERLDLVACQNDLMAAGARRALASRPEWAEVPVLGMDGLPNGGQRAVQDGELTATVVMPCNAGDAVDAVAKWLGGGGLPPEQLAQLPHSYPPEGELKPRAVRQVS